MNDSGDDGKKQNFYEKIFFKIGRGGETRVLVHTTRQISLSLFSDLEEDTLIYYLWTIIPYLVLYFGHYCFYKTGHCLCHDMCPHLCIQLHMRYILRIWLSNHI